jgi:soluble lytic murein transglycosylase
MRPLALMLLLGGMLYADITLEQINSKPPSRAKNFLIWQYFKQKITPKEAEAAFYQIKDVGINELYMYAAKTDDDSIIYTTNCMSTPAKKLVTLKDRNCLRLALTPYKFSKLSSSQRRKLLSRPVERSQRRWMKFMQGANKVATPHVLLELFVRAGKEYRHATFNRPYSKKELRNLSTESRFDKFIAYSILDPELNKIQESLLHANSDIIQDSQSNFLMGLNALRYDKKEKAIHYFDAAYQHFYFQSDKDKALFWKYMATQDTKLLKKLSESFDINIYTLYAREHLGEPLGHYYASLDTDSASAEKQDITDPFVWQKILSEVKSTPQEQLEALGRRYASKNLLGVHSFIFERATKYRQQGFIMPYKEYLDDLDTDMQAMVYAIMRQESRFIPSALSHAYAMGLMQMMPFLVHAMEKKMPQKLKSLNEMFEPQTNLTYAIKHLKWLQKSFFHPLFIAYSYNGGYGFTKQHIMNDHFTKGAYEPFMSIEMMLNSESREYGKKVLANYVVYKEILGEKTSLLKLLDALNNPKATDRFRTQSSSM